MLSKVNLCYVGAMMLSKANLCYVGAMMLSKANLCYVGAMMLSKANLCYYVGAMMLSTINNYFKHYYKTFDICFYTFMMFGFEHINILLV